MSQEHAPQGNHERQKQLESIRADLDKIADNRNEREISKADQDHGKNSEQLRSSAEQYAQKAETHAAHYAHETHQEHPVHSQKRFKDIEYDRTLTRARKRLRAPDRLLSKVVHNKAVDAASEVIGNSVARPSSMLGGAFVAFVGSSILLSLTKRLGYEYNYLMAIGLFVIGAGIGLLIEFGYKASRRTNSHSMR